MKEELIETWMRPLMVDRTSANAPRWQHEKEPPKGDRVRGKDPSRKAVTEEGHLMRVGQEMNPDWF